MVDSDRSEQIRQAIELLFFGYRAFTAGPDRLLAHRSLSRAHHRILYFIGRHPDIAIQGLLGILGVTKQALNAPLRTLIQNDLVSVCPATHDRRVRQLRLTRTGAQLEGRLTEIQMAQLREIFATVGSDAEEAWRGVMHALVEKG